MLKVSWKSLFEKAIAVSNRVADFSQVNLKMTLNMPTIKGGLSFPPLGSGSVRKLPF